MKHMGYKQRIKKIFLEVRRCICWKRFLTWEQEYLGFWGKQATDEESTDRQTDRHLHPNQTLSCLPSKNAEQTIKQLFLLVF